MRSARGENYKWGNYKGVGTANGWWKENKNRNSRHILTICAIILYGYWWYIVG